MDAFVANPGGVPYRLALSVTSTNAGTYVAVRQLTYTTHKKECSHEVPTGTSTTHTTSPTSTTLSSAATLDCTFEAGNLCNWSSPNDNEDASVNSQFTLGSPLSATVSAIFRPYSDHTTLSSSGHFAFFYSPRPWYNKMAILRGVSPFPSGEEVCLTFAYYFYATAGRSGFDLTMDNTTGASVLLFQGYQANENRWRVATLTVTPPGANYSTFSFRARAAKGECAECERKGERERSYLALTRPLSLCFVLRPPRSG